MASLRVVVKWIEKIQFYFTIKAVALESQVPPLGLAFSRSSATSSLFIS